jgi:hypothetical protein
LVSAGKIYVVGGKDNDIYHKSVEKYDPEHNQWTFKWSMRSRPVRDSVIALDDCVYAIGKHLRLFE